MSDNLGGLGSQNLSLAELRSPIEQMARTPQHIRFAESEPDQPAIPVVSRSTQDCEMQMRQIQCNSWRSRFVAYEILEIKKISLAKEI